MKRSKFSIVASLTMMMSSAFFANANVETIVDTPPKFENIQVRANIESDPRYKEFLMASVYNSYKADIDANPFNIRNMTGRFTGELHNMSEFMHHFPQSNSDDPLERYKGMVQDYNKASAFEKRRIIKDAQALLDAEFSSSSTDAIKGLETFVRVDIVAAYPFDFDSEEKAIGFRDICLNTQTSAQQFSGANKENGSNFIMLRSDYDAERKAGDECTLKVKFSGHLGAAEEVEVAYDKGKLVPFILALYTGDTINDMPVLMPKKMIFTSRVAGNNLKYIPLELNATSKQPEISEIIQTYSRTDPQQLQQHLKVDSPNDLPNWKNVGFSDTAISFTSKDITTVVAVKVDKADNTFEMFKTERKKGYGAYGKYNIVKGEHSYFAVLDKFQFHGASLPSFLSLKLGDYKAKLTPINEHQGFEFNRKRLFDPKSWSDILNSVEFEQSELKSTGLLEKLNSGSKLKLESL